MTGICEWVPVAREAAVLWVRDAMTGEWQTAGFIAYGRMTTERLRSFTPSNWRAETLYHLAGMDDPEKPPTAHQVQLAWDGMQRAAAQDTDEKSEPVPLLIRRKYDSADDFYQAVAGAYQMVQPWYPQRTTARIAELAVPQVPFTTAVHWVREARKRGYLPKSSRQTKGEK